MARYVCDSEVTCASEDVVRVSVDACLESAVSRNRLMRCSVKAKKLSTC